MSGNRSQYHTDGRSHEKAKKLFEVPKWFDIERYDCAKHWTATRWLVETELRRKLYTSYSRLDLFFPDVFIEHVKHVYDNLIKDVHVKTMDAGIVTGILNLYDELQDTEQENKIVEFPELRLYVGLRPLVGRPITSTIRDQADRGFVKSVNLMHHKYLGTSGPRTSYSLLEVDLNAPDVAIKKSFANWLEKERKRRKMPQPVVPGGKERIGKIGRPPTVGPQQRQAWARDRYLAYLDLCKLIPGEKLSLIEPKDWFVLLKLPDRPGEFIKSYSERAEWLLSDDANGLLRAEAEKESYRLTPHADDEGGAG